MRGFTLIETLLTAVLGALVLGIAVGYMIPSWRIWARASARAEMQREVLLLMDRLMGDVERTSASGVSIGSNALSLVRVAEVANDGTPLWDGAVVLYVWNPPTQQVFRRTWIPGHAPTLPALEAIISQPLLTPRRLTPDELAALAGTAQPGDQLLANGIVSFQVLAGTPPSAAGANFTGPVTLSVQAATSGSFSSTPEQFSLTRSVQWRTGP